VAWLLPSIPPLIPDPVHRLHRWMMKPRLHNFSEQLFTRFPELIETNPFRQLERFHLADAKLGTDA